jgi:tetratricopeptide (TPR) repeat protein
MAVNRDNSDERVTALNNLGNIFLKMKQNEVAMANYRLSYSLNDGANYAAYCETTIGMAKIFLEQGREDSSLLYAKMSFNKAREANFSKAIMTSGNFLAEYYRKNKNVDSAYAYLSHVIASKDSLYNEDKANQLKSLIIDETLRQQEIELNKSLAQRERHMNIQFAVIGVVLVTFVIVFFLLSRSIIVNEKWVKFLGLLALLLVFEFINLLIHPWLEAITNHSPALMLLILVCIAALLIPLHHRIEHWITHKVVAKNRVLRLAAAKRIVARLEGEDSSMQH